MMGRRAADLKSAARRKQPELFETKQSKPPRSSYRGTFTEINSNPKASSHEQICHYHIQ
jgi:hypothetical protein